MAEAEQLAAVKRYCKIDYSEDDELLAGLLAAATDWKQAYTTEFVQAMQVKP